MPKWIWRGVRSGLNMTATRGKNSDGHKKGGIQCSDGSTCCHTSYWHDAPSRLTFRHPWMKLFQLMPRFLGYFGRFSLPLFWVRFCILWTVLKIRGIFWFQGPPFAGIYMSDPTMCRLPIQLRFKGHIWPIIHRLVITDKNGIFSYISLIFQKSNPVDAKFTVLALEPVGRT